MPPTEVVARVSLPLVRVRVSIDAVKAPVKLPVMPGVAEIGKRLADGDLGNASYGGDIAGCDLVDLDTLVALRAVKQRDLGLFNGAIGAAPRNGLALLQHPMMDTAQGEPADER